MAGVVLKGANMGPPVYGVRWNSAADTFAPGIVRGGKFIPDSYQRCPIQERMRRCVLAHTTGVRQYYCHPENSNYKWDESAADLSGGDGQAVVEVPQFHCIIGKHDGDYRYFLTSERQFYLVLSDNSVAQSAVHPWFYEGGLVTPSKYKYFSAFEGVLKRSGSYLDGTASQTGAAGDLIHSVAGYKPLTYFTRTERRTYTADGVFHQLAYWNYEAIFLLMLTEYKSFASQTWLPGYTEGGAFDFATKACKTGITATLGNASGSVLWQNADAALRCSADQTGKYVANSYRGIENVFGHIWKWVDGVNVQFVGTPLTEANVYVCNNPAQFADDTTTDYADLGIDLPLASGYQRDLHDGTLLPSSASGGSSSTYLRDYYYSSAAAGWRTLRSGGDLTNGADAGFAARSASSWAGLRGSSYGGRSAA